MIFASSNTLGIAVSDRTITCAEISGRGEQASVKQTATFTLPPDLSLDKPDAVGSALAIFLKDRGFSASHAVVGVPAKWVIAVEKEVPPSNREQFRAMLRLQGERLPLAESGELVFDYVGEHDSTKAGRVLLVAILQKQLTRLEHLAEAAGLTITAVTPTALAVASAAGPKAARSGSTLPMVVLARHGAEVVWQRQGSPRMLRHVAVNIANGHGPAMGPLGLELRRAVALAPSGAAPTGQGGGNNEEMLLWDGIGLDDAEIAELSDRVGVKVNTGDGMALLSAKAATQLRTSVSPADGGPGRYAPALALALVGASPTLLPLNFVDSRLAPLPVRRFGQKAIWASAVGALLIITLATLFIQNNLLERQLAVIANTQTAMAPEIKAAREIQDRVTLANGFLQQRTPMLECLREMTETFHDDDPMWTTNFNITEDRENKELGRADGRIDGKTTEWSTAIRLADRLRANPRFSKVSGPTVSESSAGGGRVGSRGGAREEQSSFTISFSYTAASATK